MKFSLILAAALLAGCSTYSNGEPIYWGNISRAMERANSEPLPAPTYPVQTTCNTVGNRTTCNSY